jgi:hypothetical protein
LLLHAHHATQLLSTAALKSRFGQLQHIPDPPHDFANHPTPHLSIFNATKTATTNLLSPGGAHPHSSSVEHPSINNTQQISHINTLSLPIPGSALKAPFASGLEGSFCIRA